MKRTMLWMLVVLLMTAVASPAAAGVFMADLFSVTTPPARCGTIQVTGNLILVNLKVPVTGACAPPTAPTPDANTHSLCGVDFAGALFPVADLVDKAPPALGRITGLEGILRGELVTGDDVAHFEIWSDNSACTGTLNYISGFVR